MNREPALKWNRSVKITEVTDMLFSTTYLNGLVVSSPGAILRQQESDMGKSAWLANVQVQSRQEVKQCRCEAAGTFNLGKR
jgi:N-dimethylarginine dimethylaminohydrolase